MIANVNGSLHAIEGFLQLPHDHDYFNRPETINTLYGTRNHHPRIDTPSNKTTKIVWCYYRKSISQLNRFLNAKLDEWTSPYAHINCPHRQKKKKKTKKK
jgi:hypothetical protein